jgi:hypothetical protein
VSHRLAETLLFCVTASASVAIGGIARADVAVWQLDMPSQSPPRRTSSGFAFDTARDRAVVFGGFWTPPDGVSTTLGDTWEWDGSSWTQACMSAPCSGQTPGKRAEFAFAYDSAHGQTLLAGGCPAAEATCPTPLGDLWHWDGQAWAEDCTAPPCSSSKPGPTLGAAMAFDAGRGKMVLFGGSTSPATWEWNGAWWTLACDGSTCPGPRPRAGHAMAYDAAHKQTLVFGGLDLANNILSDLWAWDGAHWSQLCTSASCADTQPVPRIFATMAYDSTRGMTILYAGCALPSNGCLGTPSDAWEWTGSAWLDLAVASSSVSEPVIDESMQIAFDATTARILVLDGFAQGAGATAASLFEAHVVGDSCTSAATCDTNFCHDGICCEAACADPCDSCNTTASPGICASRASCVTTCDGNHTLTTSDGNGTVDCSPYECAPGGMCKTSCTNAADCAQPNVCESSSQSCIPPRAGGGGDSKSGCAAAAGAESSTQAALVLLTIAGGALGVRRRRAR